jgi:glycosyltransferase involved in cell wall biosynthesis
MSSIRKPLSILIMYDCIYPESIGGVEHRNHEIAKALAGRGHRVTVGGWAVESRRIDERIDVLRLRFVTPLHAADGKRSVKASIRYALACMLVPLRKYDVIETANIPYLHLFPLAIRCLIARRRLVVTWYEYWGSYWPQYVGRLRAPFFALIERLSAQIGSTVMACSRLTAARVRSNRVKHPAVPVIPCGVDLRRIRAAAAGCQRLEDLLVYAGRLTIDKRLPLLIQALARLKRSGSPARLRIVGEGPERAALEKLTAELDLGDRVEFVGRLESPDAVWRTIAGCRIAVTASSREGFGMFPLEAMACGTPVVYCESTESALPEIVGDGRCGLMAASTADSIAAQVRKLLEDADLWHRLSASAMVDAERYAWETIADQTEKVLCEAA